MTSRSTSLVVATLLAILIGPAAATGPVGSPPGGARVLQPGQLPRYCVEADVTYNFSGATYGYYWSETANRWVQAPFCYARWGFLQASPPRIVQPGATVTVTAIPDDGRMAGLVATFGGMSWSYPGTLVSGCATTDVVCTVTIGETGVRPPEWVWSEFHVSGPGRVFILPPSYAPRCQPENPCLDTYTNAWTYVAIGPGEPPEPEISATLEPTPPELFVGEPFTLRMTVRNPSEVPLSDVAPGPQITQTGEGAARLVSGPTPASVAELAPNATATFVWEFESTDAGALVLQARVEGRTPEGETIGADARCGVGETSAATLGAPQDESCPLNGGTRVSIGSCDVATDSSQTRSAGTPQETTPAAGGGFTVTSTDDDPDDAPGNGKCHTAAGKCTLRAAIVEANATPTEDTITFRIAGAGSMPPTIRPLGPLPQITGPVVLDGTSQPCVKKVELDGSAAGAADGVVLAGGASTIRGFVVNRFGGHGVVLRSDGNQVYDSVVGTGPDGKCARPCGLGNRGSGVWIEGSGNVVGDGSLANQTRGGPFADVAKNTISFNADDGVTVKSGTRNNVGGNVLAGNGDLAIDLGGDGLDKNDKDDADGGPDERMNSPVVLTAKKVGSKTDNPISGFTLKSGALYRGKPGAELRAFVYAVTECDRPDKPSAAYLLGGNYLTLSDQGVGDPSITVIETNYDFALEDATGLVYAAVDTDGNTSELSNCAVDVDGDAINDFWEESGADLDRDGVIDVPLNEMGANPKHPDIFVEVDSTGTQALDDGALDRVRQAFRNAPVTNPLDGSTGVQLHIDNGPDSEMFPGTTWGSHSRSDQLPKVKTIGTTGATGFIWDEVYDYKRKHMDADRVPFFHYLLATNLIGIIDDKGTVLGISNGIGASEVLIGLGSTCPAQIDCPGSPELQAGVLMHELGHNLGLRHGGGSSENFLPTYLSIMNYSFVPGVKLVDTDAWLLDYSRVGSPSKPGAAGAVADLQEGHLVESAGLSPTGLATRYTSMYRCAGRVDPKDNPGGFVRIEDLTEPIDWDCNDTIDASEIKADINLDASSGGSMEGYTDWPHLIYQGGTIGQGRFETPLAEIIPSEPMPANLVLEAARILQQGGRPPVIRLRGPRRGKKSARFTLTVRSQLPLGGVTTMVDEGLVQVAVPKPLHAPRKNKRKGLGYRYRIRFTVQGAGTRAVQAFVTDRALVNSEVAARSVTLR